MKQEIKDKWLEALRSGKYQQGRNQLRNGDAFCCLGVLCDIAKDEGVGQWDETVFKVGSCESAEVLPYPVADWAGLDTDCPVAKIDGRVLKLAGLNDDGTPFSEIADLIEKQL